MQIGTFLYSRGNSTHSLSLEFSKRFIAEKYLHFYALLLKNCNFDLLNSIRLVSHMSSQHMAISIGNGLSRSNSSLLPLGVDPKRHYPMKQEFIRQKILSNYPNIGDVSKRSYNGFCTRLSTKNTYIKRKNYGCLYDLINILVAEGKEVSVVDDDGWEKANIKANKKLAIINPPYKDYIYFII